MAHHSTRLLRRLNPYCAQALSAAASLCHGSAHAQITIEHWLLKLLEVDDSDLRRILQHYDISTPSLQRELTDHAGVLRDEARLGAAADAVEAVLATPRGDAVADHEVHNLATVARAVVEAARRREESRGAHTRDDFPDTSPAFAHRIVFV